MDYPVGTIIAYAGDITPTDPNWIKLHTEGWEFCNGGEVNRLAYAELFAIIATYWGAGDTSTTFNLPDFRGQFLRGCDKSALQDPDRNTRVPKYSGGNMGDNIGSYQSTATKLPNTSFQLDYPGNHTHPVSSLPAAHVKSFLAGTGNDVSVWTIGREAGEGGDHTHRINAGGDNESRGPNAYVNYIVKARRFPEFIENTSVVSGVNFLDVFSDLSGNGCVWDWTIKSNDGLNMQTGTFLASWNSNTNAVQGTYGNLTPPIGVIDVNLSATITADNVCFLGTSTSATWTIRVKRILL